LEIAAGSFTRGFGANRQSKYVRLADSAAQFLGRRDAPQVNDRLGWLGYGDPMPARDGSGLKGDSSVHTKSYTLGPTCAAWNRDVDRTVGRLQKPPKPSGTAVADDRPFPAGEGGRHPPAVKGKSRMTNGVYAAVQTMQATLGYPPGDGTRAEAGIQ